ncbi:MAG: DUF3291 domain-containing protein [Geminicoccaceae bacterium]
MSRAHHLAQLNIARPRGPLDGPVMAEFMANLARINGLGDASPGFVWRLQDEGGDATALEQPFGPDIIVNLTVWQDVETLRAFAFRSEHAAFLRRRAEWFLKLAGPPAVLWWVPAGHRPALAEAKARLELLAETGPSPAAFTFARAFGPQGMPLRRGPVPDTA